MMMDVRYIDVAGVLIAVGHFKGWKETDFIRHYESQKPFKDMEPRKRVQVLKEAFKQVGDKSKE